VRVIAIPNSGEHMDIIVELQAERKQVADHLERIDKALRAMRGLSLNGGTGKKQRSARRPLSAAGKRKIALAQKARWAKWRKRHSK
jgi:hypothetical protein